MKKLTTTQQALVDKIDDSSLSTRWYNWQWQLKNSIKSIDTFEKLLNHKFTPEKRAQLEETIAKFPLSITPYYLSLIDTKDIENDPIFIQSFPSPQELQICQHDMTDPLAEDKDSPVPCITHRYPDRVLFLVSNTCSMYCRFCTRKRRVGDKDYIPDKKTLESGLNYIRNTPSIRDVLLSGGDPFLLPDEYIDWILWELRKINHIEIIRIGTRTPVVLPYRITYDLAEILKQYHPVWVNTHFNHPREITQSSKEALIKLIDAGIPLGNQSVLLARVNDCPRIIRDLCHKLVMNRIRPYYLYQCDLSEGLEHFRTPVGKGIEIIESLIGHTSGFSVPTYVIDAPDGGGKIPIMPQYLISWNTNKIVLRNYEGMITSYREPRDYEEIFCDRNCKECVLTLKLDSADEYNAIGIEKLLADYDDAISLTPMDNERFLRSESEYDPQPQLE